MKNVPDYAYNHQYMVARKIDGELWFYGAYDDNQQALKVAVAIDGVVVRNF